jgi:hypothetical protein
MRRGERVVAGLHQSAVGSCPVWSPQNDNVSPAVISAERRNGGRFVLASYTHHRPLPPNQLVYPWLSRVPAGRQRGICTCRSNHPSGTRFRTRVEPVGVDAAAHQRYLGSVVSGSAGTFTRLAIMVLSVITHFPYRLPGVGSTRRQIRRRGGLESSRQDLTPNARGIANPEPGRRAKSRRVTFGRLGVLRCGPAGRTRACRLLSIYDQCWSDGGRPLAS